MENTTNIQTVKEQGKGYLLNGNMSVPKADGNKEYELIKLWLAEGNEPEPEFTDEEIEAKRLVEEKTLASSIKTKELSTLTVTTTAGNTFDGNETARNNMLSAITASGILGTTETEWKMADNSLVTITLDELKEALALSIQKVGEIVKKY